MNNDYILHYFTHYLNSGMLELNNNNKNTEIYNAKNNIYNNFINEHTYLFESSIYLNLFNLSMHYHNYNSSYFKNMNLQTIHFNSSNNNSRNIYKNISKENNIHDYYDGIKCSMIRSLSEILTNYPELFNELKLKMEEIC
jgi:hypothetical protein